MQLNPARCQSSVWIPCAARLRVDASASHIRQSDFRKNKLEKPLLWLPQAAVLLQNGFQRVNMEEEIAKRLALGIALLCVRNTSIENIHAGIEPNSRSGDFSDVRVVTPSGAIQWNNLSRIREGAHEGSGQQDLYCAASSGRLCIPGTDGYFYAASDRGMGGTDKSRRLVHKQIGCRAYGVKFKGFISRLIQLGGAAALADHERCRS
jgi:hypothetical protein